MPISQIRSTESLETTWGELVYTEARTQHDPHAKDLAPTFSTLIDRCEAIESGQRRAWRAEIIAQAGVDAANDSLDDTTDAFSAELKRTLHDDTESPRWLRYFKKAPSLIIRMGLATQVEAMKGWAISIQKEPEKAVKAFGKAIAAAITRGRAALDARTKAASDRADHRVREIDALIDDVNAARFASYGELLKRSQKYALGSDWADRFFRHGTRGAKAAPAPDPSEPTGTPGAK